MLLPHPNSLLHCLICPTFLAGLPVLLPGSHLAPLTPAHPHPAAGEHPGAGTALPLALHGSPWARASQAQTGAPTSSPERAGGGKGFARGLWPVREPAGSPSPGEQGLCSHLCWGRAAPTVPPAAAAPACPAFTSGAAGTALKQRADRLLGVTVRAGNLPADIFPFPVGEKRGQETKTVHLYQDRHIYMEGAMPRRTRPRRALGCCQPSFTLRWQGARRQPAPSAVMLGERHRTDGHTAIGHVQRHPE